MLSYKDNRYDSQEVFLPLLCFLELEAALTVLSIREQPGKMSDHQLQWLAEQEMT